MFVQTVYGSTARARISDEDIAHILTRALPHNLENGLTGFLYYDDWRFLQILEGRPVEVAAAMKKIKSNQTHHSLKVRLMNRQSSRNFEGWPLGIVNAEDFELRRVLKNLGHKNLLQTNVLDTIKILKRVAGRKHRTMNALEKRALVDPRLVKIPKSKISLTEDMLGLSR